MAGPFEGKWKLETSDNFDDYMKALDVSYMLRKMAAGAKSVLIISSAGDTITIKTESVKNSEISFKFGVEFDEVTADGRKAKSTITKVSDKKWDHVQNAPISSTLTRELTDNDTLVVTCEAKGVVCKRIYKRGG